jgi:phosphate-induced protein 1
MKTNKTNLLVLLVVLTMSSAWPTTLAQNAAAAQKPSSDVKTDSRILYHNGPLVTGTADVYVIWYGCWADNCGFAGDTATQFILTDFLSNVGGSPYFQINAMYTDTQGRTPSGALIYGGAALDHYSHGLELTAADIQGIVSDRILAGELPLDPSGIYLIFAPADVSSLATGFCQASAQPHHGRGMVLGTDFRYGFVGNPVRCPTIGAPQFIARWPVIY